MKRFLTPLILGLMGITTFPAMARTLTPDEALERAASSTVMRKVAGTKPLKLVYTSHSILSDEPGAYVFTSGNAGFMVLSADDDAPAILGYSDDATVSADNLAPSFVYWLEQYAAQIEAAKTQGIRRYAARPNRAPIEPLVSTRWNQDEPYNLMAPKVNGQRSVTGCVATALAQVMNYHQWPPKGQNTNSYTWNNQTLTLDFSTVTFDWNNMLDSYTSTATTTQKNAVAQLMYACGISVNMNYSPEASGAASAVVASAMYKYFNYDKGVIVLDRDYYNLYDWEEMLYNQLQNYGPVQYSGLTGTGEGHSFVCDGYSADGYFHINWGWGGMSDGYFLLTALDPDSQGIGGSNSGFNYGQDIVANVSRPKSNTSFVDIMKLDGFNISASNVPLGGRITVNNFISNGSIRNLTGRVAVKIEPVNGGSASFVTTLQLSSLPPGYGFSSWSFNLPSSMAAARYRIYPVFTTDNGATWKKVEIPITSPAYYNLEVNGNTAKISAPETVKITIKDVTPKTDIYAGVSCNIIGTMSNTFDRDFYGDIAPALYSGTTLYAVGTSTLVDVPADGEAALDYIGTFSRNQSNGSIAEGTYNLRFIDTATKTPLSNAVAVKVYPQPTTTTMTVTGLKVNSNNIVTDMDNVTITGNLRVTKGAFGGSLVLAFFPANGGSTSNMVSTPAIFAGAGQTVPFSYHGPVFDLEDNTSYLVGAFYGSNQLGSVVRFSVKLASGLESVDVAAPAMEPTVTDGITTYTGETPAMMRVFSAYGSLMMQVEEQGSVDLSSLPKGVYFIEITPDNNTPTIINRVIRR